MTSPWTLRGTLSSFSDPHSWVHAGGVWWGSDLLDTLAMVTRSVERCGPWRRVVWEGRSDWGSRGRRFESGQPDGENPYIRMDFSSWRWSAADSRVPLGCHLRGRAQLLRYRTDRPPLRPAVPLGLKDHPHRTIPNLHRVSLRTPLLCHSSILGAGVGSSAGVDGEDSEQLLVMLDVDEVPDGDDPDFGAGIAVAGLDEFACVAEVAGGTDLADDRMRRIGGSGHLVGAGEPDRGRGRGSVP